MFNYKREFKLTGSVGPPTSKGLDTRQWKHNLLPYTFTQSKNSGNKTWYVGVFRRKLTVIADGKVKAVRGNVIATTRAKYILQQRLNVQKQFLAGLTGEEEEASSEEEEESCKEEENGSE